MSITGSKLIKWKVLSKKVVCWINRRETVALFRNLDDVYRAFPALTTTIEVDDIGLNYHDLHNIIATEEFDSLMISKKLLMSGNVAYGESLAIVVFDNGKCLVGAPMVSFDTP